MTDTTFLAPSPWINDLWLPRDTLCSTESSLLSSDLPFGSLDPDGQLTSHNAKVAWDIAGCDITDWEGSSTYLSYDTSVANSECSEDVGSVDVSLDDHAMLRHTASEDCLTATVLTESLSPVVVHLLDEELDNYHNDFQSGCVSLSDWRDLSTDEDDDVILDLEVHSPSTPRSPQTQSSPSKTFSIFDALNEKITWSSLSESEQGLLVEDLSSVISSRLGIREQLEVVHLLKPNSLFSLTDNQFEIDVEELSDAKLNQVLLLLKQFLHSNNCCDHDNNNNKSSSKRSHISHHHSCRSKSFSCHGDSRNHRDSSNTAYEEAKSKTRIKTPKLTAKQRRQQQRKRNRQDLKEKRSGLFKQEEVLAVTVDNDDSDSEDVDILA